METVRLNSEVKIIELPLTPARSIEVYGYDATGKKFSWSLRITNKGRVYLG